MNVINENVIIFWQTKHLSYFKNLFLHYLLFFSIPLKSNSGNACYIN